MLEGFNSHDVTFRECRQISCVTIVVFGLLLFFLCQTFEFSLWVWCSGLHENFLRGEKCACSPVHQELYWTGVHSLRWCVAVVENVNEWICSSIKGFLEKVLRSLDCGLYLPVSFTVPRIAGSLLEVPFFGELPEFR